MLTCDAVGLTEARSERRRYALRGWLDVGEVGGEVARVEE